MGISSQNCQLQGVESPPAGSPSSWPVIDGGFPILRSGAPFRCHGDPVVDALRIERAHIERTLEALSKCTAAAREEEERYDVGSYLEGVIDDLEDGGLDNLDERWFERKASQVLECVVDAEEDEDEEDFGVCPEPETWRTFRALSKALAAHAATLKALRHAEKRALPCSENAEPSYRDGEKE